MPDLPDFCGECGAYWECEHKAAPRSWRDDFEEQRRAIMGRWIAALSPEEIDRLAGVRVGGMTAEEAVRTFDLDNPA